MTIDERLERLTERHEALTQSLELLHHDIREMRDAAAERDAREAQRDAKYDERFSGILDIIEVQSANIAKLADTAHSHERRIERLEN